MRCTEATELSKILSVSINIFKGYRMSSKFKGKFQRGLSHFCLLPLCWTEAVVMWFCLRANGTMMGLDL